jgi:hypothetical protein
MKMLYIFIKEHITDEQLKDSLQFINKEDELLKFLVDAYNGYQRTINKGTMSLITNPDALFFTKEEQDAFIEFFLVTAAEHLNLDEKDVLDGWKSRNNQKEQKNTANRG